MVLEEFDSEKKAVINAVDIIEPVKEFPKIGISCFARTTFDRMIKELEAEEIASTSCANMRFPVFKAVYNKMPIVLFLADVGAPACVALIEDLFAMGMEKLVIFGTCGVLDANIKDCSIIIPNCAVRDEGTSFHYEPASDEIKVNLKYIDTFERILEEHNCSYSKGKVWTTDGIYRETREKINKRKSQGCICVDMECSAIAALGKFRGKEIFQFFYATDNLDNEVWDKRSLSNESNLLEKDRIAMLAIEMALEINKVK